MSARNLLSKCSVAMLVQAY